MIDYDKIEKIDNIMISNGERSYQNNADNDLSFEVVEKYIENDSIFVSGVISKTIKWLRSLGLSDFSYALNYREVDEWNYNGENELSNIFFDGKNLEEVYEEFKIDIISYITYVAKREGTFHIFFFENMYKNKGLNNTLDLDYEYIIRYCILDIIEETYYMLTDGRYSLF